MNLIRKVKTAFHLLHTNPVLFLEKLLFTPVAILAHSRFAPRIPDSIYLRYLYLQFTGKMLKLRNPKSYNEKLQWLKLYDRKPAYPPMADKYEVKKIVADIIGEEHIIPTLGVWDTFEEIDFHSLPDQFVLKCTHDSGGIVICPDKSKLDMEAARDIISQSLHRNWYWWAREWVYKDIKPRVIAEQYMVDESGFELKDYKFFCFDGVVKVAYITSKFAEKERKCINFYDVNFNLLPLSHGRPVHPDAYQRPSSFEEMKHMASRLSKGIPHVRVDFYDINGKVYFGELTFYTSAGLTLFEPEEWELRLGEWIHLPEKTR